MVMWDHETPTLCDKAKLYRMIMLMFSSLLFDLVAIRVASDREMRTTPVSIWVHCYLCQGVYLIIVVCLSVCRSVC